MMAVINPIADRIREASANPFHWGAHTRSLLLVAIVGLALAVPFAYTWIRDWKMRRGFRQFWKSKAYAGEMGEVVMATAVARQSLVKEKRVKKTVPKPGANGGRNGESGDWAAARVTAQGQPVWVSPTQTRSAAVVGSAVPSGGAKRGVVNVQADDSYCDVFVDGVFFGNTPAKLTLEEGPHVVAMKRTGCKEYRRELNVHGGCEVTFQAILEEADARSADMPETAGEKNGGLF